ncbi:MAG: DUF3078 domain-containing protein [Paludibacteraceae bacterium]|nr:DUF3078 domain-containing protein [Paludibacteraceae bacterium]
MRKSFLMVALCLFTALTMVAQEEAAAPESPWKFDGTVGLNAAATGLVNWAAGGKNNVNGLAYAKLHLLYSKDVYAWETNFDTDFGMTWIDQDEDAFQKSSDNIKLATKFGWEFAPTWFLTALGSFQSQYALGRNYQTGYNNIISKWLAPSYTDISVGIDWKYSVNGADFSLYLSPVAGRITTAYIGEKWNKRYTEEGVLEPLQYIIDHAEDAASKEIAQTAYNIAKAGLDAGGYDVLKEGNMDLRSSLKDAYGVVYYNKDGQKMYDRNARAELGLSFKGSVAYKYEDFTLSSTLTLFTPYKGKGYELKSYEKGSKVADTYFQYSNMNRSFGHFDVDWDVAMGYQFLKCLQVTLQTNLKYYPGTLIANKDGEVSERCQFKGVIGIGVGYAF